MIRSSGQRSLSCAAVSRPRFFGRLAQSNCWLPPWKPAWSARPASANVEIGEVTVSGDEASAEAIVRGEVAPFDLSFLRQDGGWKFDLLPLLELGLTGFQEAAKQRGLTVDQLVEATLTQKYGAEKYVQLISRPIGR